MGQYFCKESNKLVRVKGYRWCAHHADVMLKDMLAGTINLRAWFVDKDQPHALARRFEEQERQTQQMTGAKSSWEAAEMEAETQGLASRALINMHQEQIQQSVQDKAVQQQMEQALSKHIAELEFSLAKCVYYLGLRYR